MNKECKNCRWLDEEGNCWWTKENIIDPLTGEYWQKPEENCDSFVECTFYKTNDKRWY